jgi:leader peptidase (prepilin peptidase)/N-methyltransferase
MQIAELGAWAAPVALLFGLLVGSFLNVVIHRLPRMMERAWAEQCAELAGEPPPAQETYNLAVPRSRCPSCGHAITAAENVPVLSWLLLKGRCSGCGARISARYPLVELLTGLLTGYAGWRWGLTAQGLAAAALLWSLVALTFIDIDTQLLPDSITLPLAWAGLVVNSFGVFTDLQSAVWGAVAGYIALWAVYWLFKLIRGKEGMGYGDFKLLSAIGAWLGWQMLPLVILLSSVVGAAVGIALIVLRGREHDVPLAFGPYLAAAGAIALMWGPQIVGLYFGE